MNEEKKVKVRQSHFPISLYFTLFLIFLLMSGIHTGVLVLLDSMGVNEFIQINIPILYWAIVSAATTLYITRKIKQVYEAPMREMASATAKVSGGDFSVYIAPLHTTERYDYLDVMIMDFNKMVEELRSIETLKVDFFSNVSHEFKTPLAIIQNASVLIQSPTITESERKEFANTISHACGRLNNLITNMLKLSKLEKQAIAPQKVSYDVCRQLAECAIGFEDLWEKKNINFEVDLEDEAIVHADPELMELVWNNLLSNALKFTEANGTISLMQRSDERFVTISVQDTGCGMSESVKSHIFDKFYQGDTSHATEGNGLGLALVKRILELSDAELTVSSEEGKGSCFSVKLKRSIDGAIITLVMVIYNMADIFFIGQTGNSQMVNAVAICMPIFTIVQAFGTLIGGGGSTAIALSLGKNDVESARRTSVFCCWSGIILGIAIALLCNLFAPNIVRLLGASDAYAGYAEMYLRIISMGSAVMIFSNAFVNIVRADGSAKESMIANLIGTAINIIFDPIFILGFRWGIAGAAVATVLGNLSTMLYILLRLRKHSTILSFRIKDFHINRKAINSLILGLPLACGTLLMSISYMVMNNLLASYGDNATGAFGIARSVMMLSTLTQMGICMGMQPAMSYNYGRGNLQRVREITCKTAVVTFILGTLVSAICILFRSPILHAFIDNDEVYRYAGILLIGCMCSSPIYGIFQLCAALLQATDKPSWGTIVTIMRHGIVFIPAMLLLNHIFGYRGLAFAIPVTDVCAATLGIILSVTWLNRGVQSYTEV